MALNDVHHHPVHRKRHWGTYVLGIILVLLFIGIAWVALASGGPPRLTSGTITTLGADSVTSYTLQNNSKSFAVYLQNSSSGFATIDVGMYPVLANPTASVYAASGSAYNISTYGSGNANINIRIISSNATGAKIELTPIPVGLNVGVSGGVIVTEPSPIPTGLQTVTTVPAGGATTTVAATTTISGTTTVAAGSTTTVVATTTIAQAPGVPASVYTTINASYIGTVMVGLDKLYVAGQACTPPLYNQTMLLRGQRAVPPIDFANVTFYTPKFVTLTATTVASGYLASYNITTPSPQTSGVVLTYDITALGAISNVTFKGLWTGENFTELDQGYQTQKTVNNACADYIS